ncbi:uncharacterized protein [Periplaneta americana]|uniref:uncharacterized protein isoform X2 n=1 Tax=Periplaneta americana TaxID=6978 RepID=UPI0037E9547B
MDEEVREHVKYFIKANVRRIQIALALIIIKTKPEGVTSVQHAANIQARCRLKYSDSVAEQPTRNTIYYNHKILPLQQNQLVSNLLGALPQLTVNPINYQFYASKNSPDYSQDMFDSQNKMKSNSVIDEDGSIDDEDTRMELNEKNLQFIQAMVQLKSIVNSCSYVPAAELENILSSVSPSTEEHFPESRSNFQLPDTLGSVIPNSSTSQWNTSDPGSSGMGLNSKRDGNAIVSSGILRYIIHSSDANRLLVHSVEAVLDYLGHSISINDGDKLDSIVRNWKGSVLEYSLNVMLELVENIACQGKERNECRDACIKFISNFIKGILYSDAMNMHPIWSQQCCILLEFGNSKCLCIDFLNFLIDSIQIISKNLKSNVTRTGTENKEEALDYKPGEIERCYYLFYLTENLLKKWKKFNLTVKKNKVASATSSHSRRTTVLDLWRQNLSTSINYTHPEKAAEIEENPESRWKDVLEELVTNFTDEYVLITFYAFECLTLLQSQA